MRVIVCWLSHLRSYAGRYVGAAYKNTLQITVRMIDELPDEGAVAPREKPTKDDVSAFTLTGDEERRIARENRVYGDDAIEEELRITSHVIVNHQPTIFSLPDLLDELQQNVEMLLPPSGASTLICSRTTMSSH